MTIHRSQGSQFDVVTVVLPPAESALLTQGAAVHRDHPCPPSRADRRYA